MTINIIVVMMAISVIVTMLYYTTLYYTTLYHTLLYSTLLYSTLPYDTIPYHAIPYYTRPRRSCGALFSASASSPAIEPPDGPPRQRCSYSTTLTRRADRYSVQTIITAIVLMS